MKLAIPSPPRAVSLSQIPGAWRRVGLAAFISAVATLIGWAIAANVQKPLAAQRAFLESAVEVKATVSEVVLPPMEKRLSAPAKLRVIFQYRGIDFAASSVLMDGIEAEGIGKGAQLPVLIDPERPSHAQEAKYARAQAGWVWLGTLIVGIGLLLGAGVVTLVLRREVRKELDPLRVGALVWLTPDAPLPDTKDELRFDGHYFRDDRKYQVTARGRPGRRPVRNGEKVLAAVLPSEPKWARVVDEEIATALGWYR